MVRKILLILILILMPATSFAENNPGFVVVELFTSEGCSSCPPADDLLRQLTILSRTQNKNIFPLGFHVDYWNYLGWKDSFSRGEFTNRQRRYAVVLKEDSVYTPQMVINGQEGMSGNQRGRIQQTIDRFLSVPASNSVELEIISQNNDEVIIQYNIKGDIKNKLINLALVERGLESQVTSGENAGHNLKHDNVVRSFLSQLIGASSKQVVLSKEGVLRPENSDIIGYVQDQSNMIISGAGMVGGIK